MAAAMRLAARRLMGGQRPQAVYKSVLSPLVEEEHRRLIPRLISGGRPAYFPERSMSPGGDGCKNFSGARYADAAARPPNGNTALKQPCEEPVPELDPERAWAYRQYCEIETKKHELFYLIAELDKRHPYRRYTGKNMELLFHLFGHVDPNPSDPLWCRADARERLNNRLLYGMSAAMATWLYFDWESWRRRSRVQILYSPRDYRAEGTSGHYVQIPL
ncbi:uncharacterized protein LOC123402925 [Hordeum vulgare subsp. vulgare]|uniref:uncharacterized protein LOC123402925 n=1 Tax=Hordeum vulgare subsp. vulgare TaxID=112509 RepID=UPI000B46EC6E|nr:uncharacterized protein LOC123402925 [Hordeum vulgare subsp. vulgare]